VAELDGALLHSIENLQAGHNLAGGKDLDLEFVVRDIGDVLCKILAAAIQRVERLRPTRSEPPFQLRHRLRDRRRGNRRSSKPRAGGAQEFTAFHSFLPVIFCPSAFVVGRALQWDETQRPRQLRELCVAWAAAAM
jgi:hypothetical protein